MLAEIKTMRLKGCEPWMIANDYYALDILPILFTEMGCFGFCETQSVRVPDELEWSICKSTIEAQLADAFETLEHL